MSEAMEAVNLSGLVSVKGQQHKAISPGIYCTVLACTWMSLNVSLVFFIDAENVTRPKREMG
jgi:hypothetical protein